MCKDQVGDFHRWEIFTSRQRQAPRGITATIAGIMVIDSDSHHLVTTSHNISFQYMGFGGNFPQD